MRYFLAIFALCVVATVGILGVRGTHFRRPPLYIFPDMEWQLKLRPQKPNAFFTNGISSQLHVPGTIPRSAPIANRHRSGLPLRRRPGQYRASHRNHQFRRNQSAAHYRGVAPARAASASPLIARPATANWPTATASPRKSAPWPWSPTCTTNASSRWPMANFSMSITNGRNIYGRLWPQRDRPGSLGHHRLLARAPIEPVGHALTMCLKPSAPR